MLSLTNVILRNFTHFFIFFIIGFQKDIQYPVIHIWWNILRKWWLLSSAVFTKSSIVDVWHCPNYASCFKHVSKWRWTIWKRYWKKWNLFLCIQNININLHIYQFLPVVQLAGEIGEVNLFWKVKKVPWFRGENALFVFIYLSNFSFKMLF